MHRVQRVPVTESQGRIHTSAAGVLVMPEADPVEVTIDPGDLKVDVFRSSGPGGQSVNTTDSAVRITHLPTGIVVSCQNEKSQLQNKEQAMRILRARLLAQAQEEAAAQAAADRRSQVATVDRSQRVRTYNFPENRISDHRVGYKAYNLDQVIDGDLDAVISALVQADRAEKLAAADVPELFRASRSRAGPPGLRGRAMSLLLDEIAMAAARLAEAGVESPRADAELIAAHVHGVARSALHTVPDAAFDARFWDDIARRASREPLQHITGLAYFRYLDLEVGPGVFVPRQETEVMTGWAIDELRKMDVAEPVVADLGTGSGAIALAIAQEVPRAQVHAVEADPLARSWTRAQHRPLRGGRAAHGGPGHPARRRLRGRACAILTAGLTWSSAIRRISRSIAGFRRKSASTTLRRHCGAARTGWTRSGSSSGSPGGCCARAGWSPSSTARPQGAAVYWVFAEENGWRATRNHSDLAGRDRFVTRCGDRPDEAGCAHERQV